MRWRKADESDRLVHCPNHETKNIFYARIYTIGQGFKYSETNNLIYNLKHSPTKPPAMLQYKRSAISRFATEAAKFFQSNQRLSFLLVPVPPSRIKSDPEYDDRLERVAQQIVGQCSNVAMSPLFETVANVGASHAGAARSASSSYASMRVVPTERSRWGATSGRCIVILDDVLTSGAHFEAARRHTSEQFPADMIIGVFWAKAEPLPDAESS